MNFIEILKILLLGVIEGITEWLPVSSTGHLILIDKLFPLSARDEFKNVFLYVVQFGAILAVLLLFWKKLFPFSISKKSNDGNKTTVVIEKNTLILWGKIIVACVPAAVIGLIFDFPDNPILIASALIFYGILFILIENKNKGKTFSVNSTNEITYKQALFIGLFQVLAIIPGTSRSGITILAALLLGISRPAGAEFTFFLAIPVMAGASLLKPLKFILEFGAFTLPEFGYLFIGTVTAFVISLFTVKFLMDFVKKHDFKIFGWYRIGLGVIVLLVTVLPLLFA